MSKPTTPIECYCGREFMTWEGYVEHVRIRHKVNLPAEAVRAQAELRRRIDAGEVTYRQIAEQLAGDVAHLTD